MALLRLWDQSNHLDPRWWVASCNGQSCSRNSKAINRVDPSQESRRRVWCRTWTGERAGGWLLLRQEVFGRKHLKVLPSQGQSGWEAPCNPAAIENLCLFNILSTRLKIPQQSAQSFWQIEFSNIPLQAVADPLRMACSILPGVGDVCVCQDQVIAVDNLELVRLQEY